jgi:ubiquinone/menaquinone biosynthesis C-methylase UbiE
MSDIDGIRSLYAKTADLYEQSVIPAFRPLARDLASWIVRCAGAWLRHDLHDPFDPDDTDQVDNATLPGVTALDVGTGTGILARTLAPAMDWMIGVDLSPAMLRVAHEAVQGTPGDIRLVAADLNHLPFRRGAAQLIVSSFGLNASTPKSAFRALASVLRPGHGVLAFQEWAAEDNCSQIVDDVLAVYAPDEIPGLDEPLRAFYANRKPWYEVLQYAEDYYELLKQVGFERAWIKEAPFVTVHFSSFNTFLTYKLAWPIRRLSLAAMSEATRANYYAQVHDRAQPYINPDGSFDWSPPLFRVFAER